MTNCKYKSLTLPLSNHRGREQVKQNSNSMELKDVIHFYLGCEVEASNGLAYKNNYEFLERLDSGNYSFGWGDIKPILRPLSDMSEEEMQECGNMEYDFSDDPELNEWEPTDFEIGLSPRQVAWLLSKHFDLFGLIESGAAIDKTKLK